MQIPEVAGKYPFGPAVTASGFAHENPCPGLLSSAAVAVT
jgi:hypothetical protein